MNSHEHNYGVEGSAAGRRKEGWNEEWSLSSLTSQTKAQVAGLGPPESCGIHWCVPPKVKNCGLGWKCGPEMMFLLERLEK